MSSSRSRHEYHSIQDTSRMTRIDCDSFFKLQKTIVSYSQIRCSVPPQTATLPSILQCLCANCSEKVAPEVAMDVNLSKFVDFNIFIANLLIKKPQRTKYTVRKSIAEN